MVGLCLVQWSRLIRHRPPNYTCAVIVLVRYILRFCHFWVAMGKAGLRHFQAVVLERFKNSLTSISTVKPTGLLLSYLDNDLLWNSDADQHCTTLNKAAYYIYQINNYGWYVLWRNRHTNKERPFWLFKPASCDCSRRKFCALHNQAI